MRRSKLFVLASNVARQSYPLSRRLRRMSLAPSKKSSSSQGASSGRPPRFDAFCNLRFEITQCHFKIVMGLEIHPELGAVAEVQAQPERGVCRDAPPIVDDLGDTVRRDADCLRELILR